MWLFLLAASIVFAADDSPAVARARQDLEQLRSQVEAGLVPASKLREAQELIDDAQDADVLERTLYGHIQLEDLSENQASEMVSAAQRRVDRVQRKMNHDQELIASQIAAPGMFKDVEADLASRNQALTDAKSRAELLMEIVEIARAEVSSAEPSTGISHDSVIPGVGRPEEFVDGEHLLEPKDIKDVTLAFESKFHEPFVVSARGSTAVHRALGFDHTGRIDVAVTPDSPEGVWLRKYLEAKQIPYYAFRVAIPGKATAPHIHIGPGSTRIHPTD